MLRKELIFTIILLTFLIPVTRCACGAGLYKTGGVCTVCVAGSYCSGSDTTATCSTGYYSMAGASACTQCPAGFYCTTKASLPVKCAAGTYSAAGASLCSSCGAGYVCPDGLQVACTSGSTYQTTGGKTYCDACPVGYLCTASSATACSAGAYASAGTSCATLSTGYYAPDKGSSRQCPVGFYIDSTQTTCVACEAGNYCNDGDTKTACTTGLCPAEVTAAITLATGMTPSTAVLMSATAFCAAGYKYATSTCTICATGKYCPDPTTSTETACVAGTYNSGTGKMFCYGCEPSSTCTVSTSTVLGAGSYTSDNIVSTSCASAYYCPTGEIKLACPTGTYSAGGLATCTDCPAGSYCSSTAATTCSTGQYSFAKSTACTTVGSFYVVTSHLYSSLTVCAPGQYPTTSNTVCAACPAGSYCQQPGTTTTTSCSSYTGYYCPASSTMPRICPMGYGCTSSAATACSTAQFAIFADGSCDPVTFAAGYYQSGKTSYYRAATVGYYYDSGSASLETVCAKDNYCIYGTSTSCPSGLATEFMSPTTGEPYCISCPYGSACYLTGTIETKPCLNNTRYSLSMNTDCFQCDVDHDCVYRAQYFEFRNNVADNLQCPPDQYANYFDMTCSYIKRIGKNCPYGYRRMINDADTALHWAEQRVNCTENSYYTAGTYIHLPTGAQDCVAGTTKEATTERCSVSQPGYIAPGLNEADYDTSYKCPQGYFCGVSEDFLVGVLSQRTSRCPPGTYAQTSHAGGISDSETCLACPSGMYCSGNSIATPCDTGYICDFGTLNETMTCPTGFYYSTSATGTTMYERCVQCEAGYVCGAMATTATKQACPTGYYCGVQSSTAGSYSARPGFYIGTSGATTETSCEAGKYCPQGATSGTDCPAGFYSTQTEMPSRASCIACPPGAVCTSTGLNSITAPVPSSCPANTYCPEASTAGQKCPLGTFTSSTGSTNEDGCTECTLGSYCNEGAAAATICPQGYYCLHRTYFDIETPCPDNTYGASTGLTTKESCTDCTATTTYCPEGSTAPKSCEKGYACPGSKAGKTACAAGTYSNVVGGASCLTCTAGSICPSGYHEINPISCPKGYFMASPGSSGPCTICTTGYYCDTPGMSAALGCADGKWSVPGQISCDDCPAGYYCNTQVKTICTAGYYCPAGSSATTACTAGNYCPLGAATPLKCPPGMTSAATASVCIAASAGTFTKEAQSSTTAAANACKAGYFCETGAKGSIHKPCPAGKYAAAGATGLASCLDCTGGSYCIEGTSDTTMVTCPLGNYCPTGSATPTKCPKGTYRGTTGAVTSADCTKCDAGRVCSQDGLSAPDLYCDPGYYCQLGAYNSQPTDATIGGYCVEGTYCPKGASAPVPCTAGKFNVFKGCRDVTECLACPFGFICDGTTGTNALCPAGAYCPGSTTTATLQYPAAGYHTVVGQGAQIPCGPGNFTDTTGKSSCDSCTAGKYCATSATSAPVDCTAGHFCPLGTIQAFYCREGTFRATVGAASLTDCTACTGGNYCSGLGNTAITNTCDAGYYCTLGAFASKPVYTSNTATAVFGLCPPGQYCPAASTTPTNCGTGKYSPAYGNSLSTDCFDCIPGQYCPNAVMSVPSGNCNVGYYCPSGSTSNQQTICPAGSYCPAGSFNPIKCAAGKYQASTGMGSCDDCPAGSYCPQGSDATGVTDCPQGYYCPLGTGDYKVNPCLPGTYGAATKLVQQTDCTACTAGQYCTNYGQSAATPSCAAGYYCTLNARSPTPIVTAEGGKCTSGQFCVAGSAAPAVCTATYVCNSEIMSAVVNKCNSGFKCGTGVAYTNPEGLGAVGDFCAPGSWCQAGVDTACIAPLYLPSKGSGTHGISDCLNCPYGYYCATDGLSTPTAQCPNGYYCVANQNAGTTNACPVGFACPLGSVQKVPCAQGMYQTAASQATCSACTTGNFCLYDSLLGTPAQTTCPQGTICPSGSLDHPTSCAPATYQDLTGQTTCKSCTNGNFCDRYQMTAQSPCPAGYYCPAGQTSGKANICEPGFYCPAGSATHTACPHGYYCADYGLAAATGTCSPGYYCTLGAKVPNPTDGVTGNICGTGKYCPDGDQIVVCAAGTYNELMGSQSATDCIACAAGEKCDTAGLAYPTTNCAAGKYCASSGVEVDCTIGHMCPSGTVAEILCLPGSYQDQVGQATCKDCPAGSYCNFDTTLGYTVAITCPKGYYCPAKTADYKSYPCPVTKFNPNTGSIDATACQSCTTNFYCMNSGQDAVSGPCADGYLCPAGSKLPFISANRCSKNKYCVAGVATDCTTSTYTYTGTGGDVLGASISTDCMPCLPGMLCPNHDTGITSCPAGSYCVAGVSSSCPTGHYCAAGTYAPVSCSRGTYAGTTGASSCSQCPAGSYCDAVGTITPAVCDTNLVCVAGSSMPLPCDYGNYASSNACLSCPAGRWCWKSKTGNNRGDCSDGFICYSGANSPTPYYAGIVSSTDAILNTYNGRAAKGCYTASTATLKTTANTPCPVGTYMPSVGATACTTCPPGYYCDTTGLYDITAKPCTAGYVCLGGSSTPTPTDGTKGKLCPINYYCPAGTGFAIRCAEGQMALVAGKATCDTCTAGYVCTTTVAYTACSTNNTRCGAGAKVEPLCQPGTYKSGTSCVACPAGLFCVDGRSETGAVDCTKLQCCTAGYLCTGGSPTSKPTGTGGNLCDVGYYCPEGAIARQDCPADTYIFTSGSRQQSDCTSCTEGYICTKGIAVASPCPIGNYCPTGTTGSLPCPLGTYSNTTKNTIVHNCNSCPAGYLCNQLGISNLESYPCPVGGYCFTRAKDEISCPYGSYNNLTGGVTVTSCKSCIAGYYCPELGQSNATSNSCIGGQLCSSGTAYPYVCPQSYFCSNETGYLAKICPVNYYCPPNTTDPIACITGQYCPEGSNYPIVCVSGQISVMVSSVLTCQTCPAGTYSISGQSTKCSTCEPGYVCLGGTNAQYPWSREYHNGYKCPAGAYCPAGSSVPTYCSAGTYNPNEGQSESKVCLLCKENTFSATSGQSACLPCGDSATADQGSSTCTCKGKNRAFLPSDSSCRCKPDYEYLENGVIQTDVNSKLDCQPKIYSRCSDQQIRGYDGKCRSSTDCDAECNGSGTRSPTLGICQCKDVQRLDNVCNKACRDSMPSMTITSDGKVRVNTASDPYNYNPTYMTPLSIANFSSEYMSCPTGKSCSAKSVRFSTAGSITGTYGLGPRLSQAYLNATTKSSRRLLTSDEQRRILATVTSTEISDPVMCIHEGDTMIFEIDGAGHYPVYQKDSLLNSNANFDYGAFKALAETVTAEIANGLSPAQYFAFTFTTSGRYFFTDSISTDRTLVVSVTKTSEKCPSESAYLNSRTSSSLSVTGLAQNASIMLEPDYIMLLIILVAFVLALAMLMFLMRWVTEHMWRSKDTSDPTFRQDHKKFDVKDLAMGICGKSGLQADSATAANKLGIFKDVERADAAGGDTSFLADISEGVNMQKLEELDPFIIDKILKDYQAYKDYLQKELLVACELQSKQIEDLNGAIEKMKFLLNERYEKLIALLKLDVDYTKLTNVKIKMEEEKDDGKKHEKRIKPSDIKLAKSEEKNAADVLKQIASKRNDANVASDLFDNTGLDEGTSLTGEQKAAGPLAAPKSNEEMEERIKKAFEERLAQMGDLSDFEKSKLRDELTSELINMEYVLAGERETQEIAIRRLLQARRKKRTEPTNKVPEIINEAELTPEEKVVKSKVEQQIDDEARDRQRDIEQRALSKIQKSKDKLLAQLGAPDNLSEKEKEIILSGHKAEMEQMFETIKQDKDKQLDDLQQRLERRKKAKVAEQIHALREEQQQDAPVEESESFVSIPKEALESEVVQKLKNDEETKEAELTRKHEEEKKVMVEAHAEEIKEKESELIEDLELEVEKEIEVKKDKVEELFKQRQQDLEDQRRKLKDKLLFSGGDKESGQKLMEEIKGKDDQLQQLVEAEKKEQDFLIEEKINRRRIAKQKKLLAFKNAQHDATIELRLRQLKEKQDVQGMYENEKIKEIVRRTRASQSNPTPEQAAKLYQMFEQLWNEKEAAELANLFGRQLAEKEGKLRAICNKNIEQKLMEKQAVKDRYKSLYNDLETNKSTMSPEDYSARQKQLRVEEENDLKEMDIKETMGQKKEEFALRQELEERSAGELTQLQDKMADEKLQAIRELFGNQREAESALNTRMKDMKEMIEREKDRRIKDIELDKKIILEKFENELKERFSSYEDVIKKQRETEKLIKEKKGNIERLIEERKKQMAELKDKALFTPEQEKQLLDKYQQELKTLEAAMESERNRQFALMREKLESRQGQREREQSYHKKKVAFLMGTVGKNVTLAQAIASKAIGAAGIPKNELERGIQRWKLDMEEREKSQKTTTFETLQKYLENVGKFKEKGIEGIYLQGLQYQKYLTLMKAAKILMKKLEELHRIKASGALLDLKAALKIFAEDDFDRLKARPERIGGGFRCFDDEGNILWELFKFIHS